MNSRHSERIPAAEPVVRLIEELNKLPGVGPKSAQRLTYHLVRMPAQEARALAEAIQAVKDDVGFCSVCWNITDQDPCIICVNQDRDRSTFCVVEDPLDVLAVERTGVFKGLYHVLHGAISPVNGIGPEELRVKELLGRLRTGSGEDASRRPRGDPRHQPQPGGRGHRHVPATPPCPPRRSRDPPGPRPLHRGRAGVRRRAHPNPGL